MPVAAMLSGAVQQPPSPVRRGQWRVGLLRDPRLA